MSTLKVDKIDPSSGTALEIGSSGDTMTVPSGAQLTVASGATIDVSGCTLTPPATMPASSGVNLTALNATQLTSGTVPDDRFPATLPAKSGVNLTALNATNLGSGAVPATRMPAGSVIQTTAVTQGTTETSIGTTNNTWVDTVVTASITTTSDDSDVLIFVALSAHVSNDSGDAGYSLRMKRGGTPSTAYPDSLSDWAAGSTHSDWYQNPQGDTTTKVVRYNLVFLDSPEHDAASITYTLQGSGYNVEYLSLGGGYGAFWMIFFQEIKR